MPLDLGNTASVYPYLRYSPQANTWFVSGEGRAREIEIFNKPLVIDIENGQRGHLAIATGSREWVPLPLKGIIPAPANPNAKLGFSVLVYAPAVFGDEQPREVCSNTASHNGLMRRIYDAAEPRFDRNEVPVVTITGSTSRQAGMGTTRDLAFTIEKWVPRPQVLIDAALHRKQMVEDQGSAYASAKGGSTVPSGKASGGAKYDLDGDDIPFSPEFR